MVGVAVEDARLERQDVVADPAERPEVGRVGRRGRPSASSSARDADRGRVERHAVEPRGVVEHGVEARGTGRRRRSARRPAAGVSGSPKAAIVRARPCGLTTLPLRAELPAELADRLAGVVAGAIDPADVQGGGHRLRGLRLVSNAPILSAAAGLAAPTFAGRSVAPGSCGRPACPRRRGPSACGLPDGVDASAPARVLPFGSVSDDARRRRRP